MMRVTKAKVYRLPYLTLNGSEQTGLSKNCPLSVRMTASRIVRAMFP
jgi:hypothetical protein